MARERSLGSEIEAKADGDCKLVLGAGVCAELETEAISAAQHSKVGSDTGRIMPGPSIAITNLSKRQKVHSECKICGGRIRVEADRAQSVLGSEIATGRRSPALPAVVKIPDAAIGSVGRLATPQTAREPIGPGAIVVDRKSGSTLYLLWALGRLMQGGLHA